MVQYKVFGAADSTYQEVSRSDDTALAETVTGLTNDTQYTVRVRAVNAAGDSPWSAEASATPVEMTAPSVDSAVVVEAGAEIEIVFDEDLAAGSTVAAGEFDVTVGAAAAVNPSGAALSTADADTVVLTMTTAIAAGETVTVAYTAPATGGLADAGTNKVESFTGQVVFNRAAAPVVTLAAGDTQITATWAAPADGGSAVTSYEVQHKPASAPDADYTTVSRSDVDALTETITGLTNDTQYTVRVLASNKVGNSPWSAEASATPVEMTAPSVDSAVVVGDGAEIEIVFDEDLAAGSTVAASEFDVTVGAAAAVNPSGAALSTADADTVVLTMTTAIAAGETVTVAYTAPATGGLADANANKVESFTQAVLNRPAAPVVTLAAGDTQITATWAAPADGGSPITSYEVQHKPASPPDADYTTVSRSDVDALTETITGLVNDTEYTVRVLASNKVGNSPPSAEVSATPVDLYRAPAARTCSRATARWWCDGFPPRTRPMTLHSRDGRSNGAAAPRPGTAAAASATSEKGRDDDGDDIADGLSFETTVSGLSNGADHAFRIRARVTDLAAAWTDTAVAAPAGGVGPQPLAASLVYWALVDTELPVDVLDGFDVVLRIHDSYTFIVNDEGLKEPVYLRSVWMESYVREEVRTVNGAFVRSQGSTCLRYGPGYDSNDRGGSYELTLLHPGAAQADWEHVGYAGNVYQIPQTAFGCREHRAIRPFVVNGFAGTYEGRTTWSLPDPVPETAALGPVVAGDGALTVRWQEQLWAGARILQDQFGTQPATDWNPHIQWVPDGEQFESDPFLAVQGGAARRLRGTELKEALLAAEYTITGLDNGTAYKVRFVYDDEGSYWVDRATSNVVTGTPVDTTAPMAVSASVAADSDGDFKLIEIVFSETLVDTSGSAPAAAAFGVKAGSAAAVEPSVVEVSGGTVTLTLDTAIEAGAAVSVAYDPPASNPLQDAADLAVGAFTVSAPNRPAAPSPTAAPGDGQLTVKWFPPADGGSPITGYRVDYKTGSEPFAAVSRADAAATSETIEGLANGTAYTVRVIASNAAGDGPWSEEMAATPQAADTTAPVPAYAFVDENAADEFKLVKIVFSEALVDTSGSVPAASAFAVVVGSGNAAAPSSVEVSGDTVILTMAAAVTAGEPVTVAYSPPTLATAPALADSAGNKVGSFAATAAIPALNRPAAPAAPTVTAGESSLIAAWAAPAADGGSPVTGYRVEWRIADSQAGTQTWDQAAAAGQAATGVASGPYTVPGLTNDVEYTVRVIAVNAAGDSPPSAEASESPGDMTPPTPVSAKVIEDGAKIEVTFDEPLDDTKTLDIGAFLALVTVGTTETTHIVAAGRIEAATVTVTMDTAIPAGATVTLTYTAPVGGDDLADPSGNEVASFNVDGGITVLNRPAAPPVTLTAGDGELTVAWTEPANGGSAISGYRVEWRIADSQTDTQTWSQAVAAGQASDHGADIRETTLQNLTNNTAYTVRVTAVNAADDSPWSDEMSATPADILAPAPTSASVAADSDGDFKLIEIVFGEALVDTSGSAPAPAAFDVTVGSATAVSPSSVAVSGDTVTLTMAAAIAAGQTVSVTYTAPGTNPLQDAGGNEVASFAAVNAIPVLNRPALTLTEGDRELTATWTAPAYGGSAISGYRVEWRIADSQTDTQTWSEAVAAGQVASDVASSPHTISSLAAGTEYTVRVIAVYAAGDGPPARASATPFLDPALIVPTNWELLPSGLSAGDEFRLLFVTSERRNAVSTDIDVYNAFVQDLAASGHDAIRHRSDVFRVLGSTAAVDARDNTGTLFGAGTPVGNGLPIWWLNGPNAADHYLDFYDGNWDHSDPGRDQHGDIHDFTATSNVFTGSTFDGQGAGGGGFERVLGSQASDGSVNVGSPGDNAPIGASKSVHRSNRERFYGLSGVFLVGPDSASDDITLSDLTVDGTTVADFAANMTEYAVTASVSTTQVTVAAAASDSGARVRYETADADDAAEGHQVTLGGGGALTTVTLTVVAANGASQDYTLRIGPVHVVDVEVDPEPTAGKYIVGDTITITVTFSDDVAVTFTETDGPPTFPLQIGSDIRHAAYDSGTGTDVLVFTYAVQPGDSDNDGIANAQSTLDLPTGASIKPADDDTVDAYPGPIDLSTDFGVNRAPVITDFEISSTPQAATDTYGLGEDITFIVTFNEAVTVEGDVELGFNLSGQGRVGARLASGNGTRALVFAYTVQSGDTDADGIFTLNQTGGAHAFVYDDPLFVPPGDQSIVSAATGVAAVLDGMTRQKRRDHKIDGSRTGADATLSALSLSGITLDQTFTAGAAGTAVTSFTATTNAADTVVTATASQSGGSSAVAISPADADLSTADHDVAFVPGDDTVITVTVTSTNGDSTRTYTVTVTRGADTTAPAESSAKVSTDGTTIEITFDEDLDTTRTPPAASAFAVTVDGGTAVAPTSVAFHSTRTDTIILTMGAADTITAGETVSVAYTTPTSNALADAAGNEVAGFSGQGAAGLSTAPTVSFALISADRATIDIVFDKALDTAGTAPAASAFEVSVDGGTGVGPSSVAFHSTDTITLTMAPAVAVGDAVSVAYAKPSSDALVGANGQEAAGFTADVIVAVTAQFGAATYTAVEGGSAAEVTLTLDADPHRTVSIEFLVTPDGGADSGDVANHGVTHTVTFASGETAASFTVEAEDDDFYDGNDNDELVVFVPVKSGISPGVTMGAPRTATVALVDNEFLTGSSLVPHGTDIGDEFRLLFVTSGTTAATSTDIDYYNMFVQDAAAAGHADIAPYSRLFRALGSTASVSARDNTATNHTTAAPGVPIRLLNGEQLAADYSDFYGFWTVGNPWPTESGEARTFFDPELFLDPELFMEQSPNGVPLAQSDVYLWTGSTSDGDADSAAPLGASPGADVSGPAVGSPVIGRGEIALATADPESLLSLYGLSYVLRAAVPADRPHVSSVAVVDEPSDGGYVTGETITVAVTFSETVDVTGDPTLALSIGKDERDAVYQSGTGSDTLEFEYVVVKTDRALVRVTSARRLLVLPSGAAIIREGDDGVPAYLGPISLSARLTVNPDSSKVSYAEVFNGGRNINLVFDRLLGVRFNEKPSSVLLPEDFTPTMPPPPLTAFSVTFGDRTVNPTEVRFWPTETDDQGNARSATVRLTFDSGDAIAGATAVTLAYDASCVERPVRRQRRVVGFVRAARGQPAQRPRRGASVRRQRAHRRGVGCRRFGASAVGRLQGALGGAGRRR